MNLLRDTHVLLWAASGSERLSDEAQALLLNQTNELIFSSASLWEISIKRGLERADFKIDPRHLWRMLLAHGYRELPIGCVHAVAVTNLPVLHKDPFDRVLLAQAREEGLTLLTADPQLARYGKPVLKI